jgi:transcriptional regulator with XRE-family HTH domain
MSTAIAKKLDTLRSLGGIKSVDVANLLNTTPETVSRWNQGKSSPRGQAERTLLELEYILEKLSQFYEDPEDRRLWLYSRQKLLSDQKPADLVQQGRISEVLEALDQLQDLVYL